MVMSWGYLLDLRCTLSARAWAALQQKRPADFPLADDWSAMRDSSLREYFAPPSGKGAAETFAEVLEWPAFTSDECLRDEKKSGAKVQLRVALALDRSQLELVGYLGALLAAVQAARGEGKLALINDGTYVGEDGHELVVRDGKRTRRAFRNYESRRDKLVAELFGEEDDEAEHVAAPPAARLPDATVAMQESFALYQQGEKQGARERLDAFFAAGGVPYPSLLVNYTAFLRMAPPEGEALARANKTVLDELHREPAFRANRALLENAVAYLNENGCAAESVDIVLRAASEGLELSPVLATNVAHSAAVAKDPRRIHAVMSLVAEAAAGEAFNSEPYFFQNWGTLHTLVGDHEAAMSSLERAVSLHPPFREKFRTAPEYEPLRGHERWSELVRER